MDSLRINWRRLWGTTAQESTMPPKRITSKTTRAATGEDNSNTRDVALAATAIEQGAAGPSALIPERSLNTNHRSRGAAAESGAQGQTAAPAITTNDIQQIIRDELLKILQPQIPVTEPPPVIRSRDKQISEAARQPAPQEGANSPGRSRHSVFERLGALSARDRLGSRGVRLAREKREELERLREAVRAKKKAEEAELEGSSTNDGEAEVMSGLKNRSIFVRKTDHQVKSSLPKKTSFGKDPNSPFSSAILDAPLPLNYKPPKISRYDGTTAPKAHISCFMTAMRFTGYDEAAYCQAFPMTLEGPAQTWFTGLKPGSIGSWDELAEAFQTRFFASSDFPKDVESLLNIVQKEGESLKSFFRRFCEEQQTMENLDPKFALTALRRGVRHKQLLYDFHTNPPETLTKAYEKVRLTIEAEEREAELTKGIKRQRDVGPERDGQSKRRKDGGKYEPKFHNYT